jgi:hypothetical protein
VQLWRETPNAYPKFSGDRQFKVELYFLEKENEGNYFFDKNQRPKPTAKSKAYDLTTLDDLSLLAKETIEKSTALKNNVNRVTDRLSARSPHVVTLSTLREMMRTFASTDSIDAAELEGLATVAAQFYDLLAEARPELGTLPLGERNKVRKDLIVDSATMMHGYAALMRDYNQSLATLGAKKASTQWRTLLRRLGADEVYHFGKWKGDFFAKANPLWEAVGIVKARRDSDQLTVLNTGGARGEAGKVLRLFMATDPVPTNINFLARV